MTLYQEKYRIESTRLPYYDYSSEGAYFITICTKNREHYFGEIINGKLTETMAGKIVMECWNDLPFHYPNCILDEFVIMPNHVHGIIIINNTTVPVPVPVETGLKPVSTTPTTPTTTSGNAKIKKPHSLSEMVRAF